MAKREITATKRGIAVAKKDKAYVIRLSRDEGKAVVKVLRQLMTARGVSVPAAAARTDPGAVARFFGHVHKSMCESRRAESKVIVIDVE